MSLLNFKGRNHPQQTRRREGLPDPLFEVEGLPMVTTDDTDDRGTDPELFRQLDNRYHFTLDVAASHENAKCERYLTKDDHPDGLHASWERQRVWCNPPYSNIAPWVQKAHEEAFRTEVIVMLLPANRTEQAWWQDLVEPYRDVGKRPRIQTEFLRGRRRFVNPGHDRIEPNERPPFGCVLLIWKRSVAARDEPQPQETTNPPACWDDGSGGRERDTHATTKASRPAALQWDGLTPPYSTIVADPPWPYDGGGPVGTGGRGSDFVRANPSPSASAEYSLLSMEGLRSLDVAALAAADAHLYVWTTNAFMVEAHELCREWGFRPKTILTWTKTHQDDPDRVSMKTGYWFRGATEHVVFGVRGSQRLLTDEGVPTGFLWPRIGSHSVKPAAFFDLVERVSPAPRVELFARAPRLGWDHWGYGYEVAS